MGERSYSFNLDQRNGPLLDVVVLVHPAYSLSMDRHRAVKEEGDTWLASQISQINGGGQWGDRCHSQIALT